ncbi:MAG: cytochrome P450, partial [Streptomyces sp.]|nr:cytochrome P450 [Streptomyces sp.]
EISIGDSRPSVPGSAAQPPPPVPVEPALPPEPVARGGAWQRLMRWWRGY